MLSQKHMTTLLCFSKQPFTLEGLEPRFAVSGADAMPTAQRNQGSILVFLFISAKKISTKNFWLERFRPKQF
jgi:hypothetical protein